MSGTPILTFREHDGERLRSALKTDPVGGAYLLGDLDPPYFQHTSWFVATWEGDVIAVLLCYTGLSSPVLVSYGAPDGAYAILEQHRPQLPHQAYVKLPPAHDEAWRRFFIVDDTNRQWFMGVGIHQFRAVASDYDIRRLRPGDVVAELNRLYVDYPGHFFEVSQLGTGVYYGVFLDSNLVCVAGTHVFSPAAGVAVLGNIVTARGYRGRGLATACTSRVIEELLARGCHTVTLQVAGDNPSAIAVYRRLGFRFHSEIVQGRVTQRSE